MKEVELLPDDPKSAECMRQLQQVVFLILPVFIVYILLIFQLTMS